MRILEEAPKKKPEQRDKASIPDRWYAESSQELCEAYMYSCQVDATCRTCVILLRGLKDTNGRPSHLRCEYGFKNTEQSGMDISWMQFQGFDECREHRIICKRESYLVFVNVDEVSC